MSVTIQMTRDMPEVFLTRGTVVHNCDVDDLNFYAKGRPSEPWRGFKSNYTTIPRYAAVQIAPLGEDGRPLNVA